MKHMAYRVIDRLFLVVFGAAGPTDDEWMRYLGSVQRHAIDRTMQLVVTDGGLPTYAQRRYLSDLLPAVPCPSPSSPAAPCSAASSPSSPR